MSKRYKNQVYIKNERKALCLFLLVGVFILTLLIFKGSNFEKQSNDINKTYAQNYTSILKESK